MRKVKKEKVKICEVCLHYYPKPGILSKHKGICHARDDMPVVKRNDHCFRWYSRENGEER